MRISTGTIYEQSVASLQSQTSKLVQIQQQISANRRMLTPADDPSASARVLEVSQSQAISLQYDANIGSANDALSFEETILVQIVDLLQSAKDVASSAGNGAYSASDRSSLAVQLRGQYQQLLGLANSTDSAGQYLFSGYKSAVQPFTQTAPGTVSYNGDEGRRLMQVGPTRRMEVNDSGEGVFQRIPNGNGHFVTSAAAANTGTGLVGSGNTLDPMKWNDAANGKSYSIQFFVAAGVTSYDIVDTATGASWITGDVPGAVRTYTSGSAIRFSRDDGPLVAAMDLGAEVTISGDPQDGDVFNVAASTSQDMFKTTNDLIDLLESGASGVSLANKLGGMKLNLDNAIDNVLSARAGVGSRLKELDALKNGNDSLALDYSQTLSRLQDVDYAKAASDFAKQQVTLQAAQQTFVKISGLSLFNYL